MGTDKLDAANLPRDVPAGTGGGPGGGEGRGYGDLALGYRGEKMKCLALLILAFLAGAYFGGRSVRP